MESLWPNFEEPIVEKNNTLEILRAQARAIKTQTKGAICATFSKMNYKAGPTNGIKVMDTLLQAMSSPEYEEVLEDDLKDKKDINILYKNAKYKFEIFNNEYRFRLFIVHYREMFPVTIDVDEGILPDIEYKNLSPVLSNSELESIIKDIFRSNKVYSVVSRMLQKEETEKN